VAIDTRQKRASACGVGLDFLRIRPVADGAISATDRQHLNFLYSGITSSVAVSGEAIGITLYVDRARGLVLYVDRARSITLER